MSFHSVIRADGGPSIGYGHLVRSSALATELLDVGNQVTYATATPTDVAEVCPDEISVVELPSRDEPTPLVNWIDGNDVDAVFVDSYPVDTSYQHRIREHVPLMVFRDDASQTVCADAFVNGNLYGAALSYEYECEEPSWYLGPDYCLLRREIRNLADEEPPIRERPERVLVTMGGSDVANMTVPVVRALDGLNVSVDVIVGPGFTNEKRIRSAVETADTDMDIVRTPTDLPERMFNADLAVTACGSTVYELLALGTPFVGIPVVENQQLISRTLRQEGLAKVVEKDAGSAVVRDTIVDLIDDVTCRKTLQEAGRERIDALGAQRLATELLSIAEETSET